MKVSLNHPNPAIVAQGAVRRLPRLALLLLCLAYVLPGFIGREPWKSADMASFGAMAELAQGATSWWHPQLLGQEPQVQALLPYWLGAWAMQWAPSAMAPDLAARIPFMLLLALTLAATWYGVYYLARSAQAQPVSFAFGGEAHPKDYSRAVADGGLLALIACLGLAQLSHETTPALAQLAFCTLSFYGLAAMPYRPRAARAGLLIGLIALGLSGAPTMALLFGLGGAVVERLDPTPAGSARQHHPIGTVLTLTLLAALCAWALDQWHWRVVLPAATWTEWQSLGRLWLWFSWPAWPLALWTLWSWRRQAWSRHMALPIWFGLVGFGVSFSMAGSDRALLLTLPAVAALAAFALPTLSRSLAALIDWFTLLFFSGCAIVIWVVWIAMQTGVPPRIAANVTRRLAHEFVPTFSLTPFLVALCATLAWCWLVRWRTGRHRAAIWKSLVLPAGGTVLGLVLIMTLWLEPLDFARSYAPLVRQVAARVQPRGCVQVLGLNQAQIAAFRYHGQLELVRASNSAPCDWLLLDADAKERLSASVDGAQWRLLQTLRRPSDDNEDVMLFRRRAPSP